MDNKNEKTFSDLFSSSTSGTEKDKNAVSTESNDGELKIEKSKSEITFDNLFDQVALEKTSPENSNPKSMQEDSLNYENNHFETDEKSENEISNIQKEDSESFNPFGQFNLFEKTGAEKEQNKNDINDSSFTEENIINHSKSEENNSFFEEEPKPETFPSETINFFEEPQVEETPKIEEKKSPFFEETQKPETPPSETINFFEEPQVEETPKIEEEKSPFFEEEPKPETPPSETINFFEEPQVEESPKTEEEKSPFFEEEPKPETPSSETINFFEEPQVEESSKIEEEKSPFFKENDVLGEITPSQEQKSVSPFFEDSTLPSAETNPLFNAKINLMENQKTEQKIGAIDPTKSKHYRIKIVKKKEPLSKFIIGVLSYAIFIWLLLIGITLLVYVLDIKIRAAKGDYSSPTFNAYVVLTGSMLPDIQVYDVVVTKKVDAASLEEGDIITFASADSRFLNTIITHRIMKKNYDAESNTYTFQTKGDNNNVADSALVPQSNIYGKVILKIPKLGYLQEFLASDGGWIIVILIPCLTVMSYDIVKIIKGLKKKKYKNIKVQK